MGTGILLLALSGVGLLKPVQNASYVMLAPLESLLRSVAQPIADTVTNYSEVHQLSQDNDALRAENERLNADVARLSEQTTQLDELQRLLDVKNSLSTQTFMAANVIARAPGDLRQQLALNRGTSDGIKIGMPVVTEGNTLVGTVTTVDSNHAWVTLVTDVDSAVSSLILESRAQGVVSGGYNQKLTMEFVSQESSVNAGDTVITSGLGGSYPEGLVIGKVTDVGGQKQDLFRSVSLAPLASLSRLETVLIMTSFVPTKVTP